MQKDNVQKLLFLILMHFSCPYCDHLKKAIKGHNYCSQAGDILEGVRSNAYYLETNQMFSGQHISRLSIRGVINGYQYYRMGQRRLVVKQDNYLIVNEGQSWWSEIESERPVEMVVVAFHPKFTEKANYALSTSPQQLLANPFSSRGEPIEYFENTYASNQRIQQLFLGLKSGILSEINDELFFEQLYFDLLASIFEEHQHALKQASLLPAKKVVIRQELFKRLGVAKDFMDANFDQKITLQQISREAALSPYHFLRLFKSLHRTTPFQYLTSERLKAAQYLLANSSQSVLEISESVGFENNSAFGRSFKRHFGVSPARYRILQTEKR